VTPRPFGAISAALCRSLAYLFTDIDDTLTSGGMLPSGSFQALWDLSAAGLQVVPVTGRPAGWCDHIARMWPVAAVIGENGAFYYSYDRGTHRMRRRSLGAGTDPAEDRAILMRVAEKVLRGVPGTALAADQPFRVSDVAVDYCEDVPPLGADAVDAICAILRHEGVSFRVSSIHVNFWRGAFDKMSGVRAWLSDACPGVDPAGLLARSLFIGDSPNDEPLFHAFPHSVAVANLARFLPRISHVPEFITAAESAEGFCEACREILNKRAGQER